MTKTLLVTLELPVRVMTDEEWEQAWDDCGHLDPDDESPDREETLEHVTPADMAEAISAALNSTNNGDFLAGTGLFVTTDDALITSVSWKS
jgi:hypothetical protein